MLPSSNDLSMGSFLQSRDIQFLLNIEKSFSFLLNV